MLKELSIQNFKAWESTGPIRLAPLTIFCGTNSSGKSSLAQFLLMLKQTVESSDRQRVLHLGDKDTIEDLGTFNEIIFQHNEKLPLGFEVKFESSPVEFTDAKSGKKYGPYTQINFGATILQNQRNQRITLEEFHYKLVNGNSTTFSFKTSGTGYQLGSSNYNLVKRRMRPWDLPAPENFYGFPDEVIAYYQNTGFLPDLTLAIKNLFKSIYYVGPLRNNPQRQYIFSGEIPQDVGVNGDKTINAILSAADRKIAPQANKRAEKFDALVARWLKQMNLIDSFRVVPIAKGRKEYEVKVRIKNDSSEVLIADVGFGISQVLPVLVQSFYVPNNSILLFEQPEIHLHPSVQAHLGDMFIEAIHSRENKESKHTQILVESHSEHLIRRIQRRIAEDILPKDDVAIYFISQKNGKSNIEELKLDLFGNITNWPDNFFGNDLEDLTAMTKAAINRKKKKINA